MYLKIAMKPNTGLSYKGILKINVHKPFILFYTFFNENCAWISLDFLVQKNLDNFVDYFLAALLYCMFNPTINISLIHSLLFSTLPF